MPPRGYRDQTKRLERSIEEGEKELVKLCSQLGQEEESQRYRKQIAVRAEAKARRKAASGREPDLLHLVKIAAVQDHDAVTAWAAAGMVADKRGGDARIRHANRKRLYRKFQEAPALYRRLASAADSPEDAASREIWEALEARVPTGQKWTPQWWPRV